ncbi:hypothetical protein [Arthrobacter globiformis]|uniref:hypothetical protein n=1 Tax=Arthrobacter globiformis TaxID=1665 RepID=UPI0027919427|nr:hypothetical protein [Arthrobacter globiformis]MDQ0620479.1 hypothetical protein [Arthrobacter globiformis]
MPFWAVPAGYFSTGEIDGQQCKAVGDDPRKPEPPSSRKAPMSYSSNQPYQYPNYPNVQQNNSREFFRGSKFKEKSVIFGVIGFFFLGIVFGPLAISNARKAEALHHSATLGKVLGWIDTIAGVLSILVFVLIAIAAASGSGN